MAKHFIIHCSKFITLLLLVMVLPFSTSAQGIMSSTAPAPQIVGKWKCQVSDNGLYIELKNDHKGTLGWRDGNKQCKIYFKWQVHVDNQNQLLFQPRNDGTGTTACLLYFQMTGAENVTNEFDKFDILVAYYSLNYNNGNVATIVQLTRMWRFEKEGGGSASSNTGTGTGGEQDMKLLKEDIDEYRAALKAGNKTLAASIRRTILQKTQHLYPNLTEVVLKILSEIEATSKPNVSATNNVGNAAGANQQYAEGWIFLKQFQQKINEYINEFNKAIKSGNTNRLLQLSTELNKWIEANQHIFNKLTPEQLEAFMKMMQFFSDMIVKNAMEAVESIPNIAYADEAEKQSGFVPNIQTKPITVDRSAKGTYSEPVNKDGLQKGGSIDTRPQNGTQPNDQKRKQKKG